MTALCSSCLDSFGYESFDRAALGQTSYIRCPVLGCSTELEHVPFGLKKGKTLPWCPTHGIRLHAQTFVYWNGEESHDEARLRNFIVRQDLARKVALPMGKKAESHRLGYEMSEDALSWNVFVSLAAAGCLRDAAQCLTGRKVEAEPELYIWGRKIDLAGSEDARYPELDRVGSVLEKDIRKFKTEPDVMLVLPGEMVICIEAKFGSGNTLADEAPTEPGQKPTSRSLLLSRYLEPSAIAKEVLLPAQVPVRLHSQLFRNIVFACEMARGTPWHVVNLVSSTQWSRATERPRGATSSAKYSFQDPTESVRSYLRPDRHGCFTFRTWEALHAEVIRGDSRLRDLDAYLHSKSAHFLPAFALH